MQVGRLEGKQKKRGEKGKGKKTKVQKVRYLSSRPKVQVCIYIFGTMVRLVVVVVVVGFIHEPTTFLPSPSLSLSLYPRSIFHIHSSFKGKKDYLLLVLWGGVLFDLLLLHLLHLLVTVVAVVAVVVVVVRATLHTSHPPSIHNRVVSSNSSSSSIT